MNRDFIDDDLNEDIDSAPTPVTEPLPAGPQVTLTAEARERLAQQKEQLTDQVSGRAEELESLRRRQKDIEQEKKELEELSERQRGYEMRKKEAVERLGKWLLQLEREHARAVQQVEVFSETRRAFEEALRDLRGIDEASWEDETFGAELDAAMVRVEDATSVWRRGVARAEAVGMVGSRRRAKTLDGDGAGSGSLRLEGTFLYWLKVGTAVCLPLALVATVFFIAWLAATGIWPR